MEKILVFINNPWVVGIIGGIISGIAIFLFSSWMAQRNNIKQISEANSDILNILLLHIIGNGIKEKGKLDSLINAIISTTAIKYSINSESIYPIRTIYQKLIYQISDNIAISEEEKTKHITKLTKYLSEEQLKLSHKLDIIKGSDEPIDKYNYLKTVTGKLNIAMLVFTLVQVLLIILVLIYLLRLIG